MATKHSARTSGTSAPELPPPLPTSSCLPWRRSPVPGHRDPGAGAVNSGAGAAETGAGAESPAPPRGDGPGGAGPAPRSRLWAKTTCAAAAVYPCGEFHVHGPAPTGKANYSTLLQGLMVHGRFVRMGVWLKGTTGIPRIDGLVP